MINPTFHVSRRRFIASGAAVAALTGVPSWYLDRCGAAEEAVKKDEKPATQTTKPATQPELRIGLVGCGGMGTGDARNAQRFGKIVAVCDVDDSQLLKAQDTFPGAKAFHDFRKLVEQKNIDVVLCGTVDHWHTLVSMAAMKAGKDVYCEKPLTLTIDEGKRLVQTQRETKRILQTGTQQRSDIRFRLACDLVRNGRIGKLKHVSVWVPAGLREGPFKPARIPNGFDFDMWQGQTPAVEYVKERTHRTFRYWWEYSGGTITDWGAHHNDVVLWALGQDRSGPVAVDAKPTIDMIPGGYTANSEYEITYTYDNGVTHSCKSTRDSAWNGAVVKKDGQLHGIKFEGSDGHIWVTRGTIEASDRELLKPLPETASFLPISNDHMKNFIDGVKTRTQPICEAEIGHRSATLCHLAVISLRQNQKLTWDPKSEHFTGEGAQEANKHLAREQRKPWTYDCL